MFKILDVPTSSITELKKDSDSVLKKAIDSQTGVYILNRNKPAGILLSVEAYESMVKKLNELEVDKWKRMDGLESKEKEDKK